MQMMLASLGGGVEVLELPPPRASVMPGVDWGSFDHLCTAAYWKGQAWQAARAGKFQHLRLGRDLIEETSACLLGGYGMRAELGLAAFRRLRERGVLVGNPAAGAIEAHLLEPFVIDGQSCRYRYPRQKAAYLSRCLKRLQEFDEPEGDVELRDGLAGLPGIGLKTASWIVRNHRASNEVAVIDVHIVKACRLLGLFPEEADPQRHYRTLEGLFLKFAQALEIPASLLDALMWHQMRLLGGCLGRVAERERTTPPAGSDVGT